MQKDFDIIILGAGIAGASIAYEFSKNSLSVLVIDRSKIASGGSNAAGAFISPKISKPSFYKDYINSAFNYSTKLYRDEFGDLFSQCGLDKYPLDRSDLKRLESYEEFLTDLRWQKRDGYYHFFDAGVAKIGVIDRMLDGVNTLEDYNYEEIFFDRSRQKWRVDSFSSTYLFIATATLPNEFNLEYIKLKSIGGYRYDVTFKDMQNLTTYRHKDLSISLYQDNRVMIGASFIRHSSDLELDMKLDRYKLIKKADDFMKLDDLKIINGFFGKRVSTYDYLPIVGKVVDQTSTLSKYPYIKNGSKVPPSRYIYHKNLFIHIALSSRGFVTAPYNAKLLYDFVAKDKEIDDKLTTVRLFKKWARRRI